MTCKTVPVYRAIFQKLKELVPQFTPESAITDFEDASASAFHAVYGDVHMAGYRFHYGQAIVKRLNKIGLKEAYVQQAHVKELVHYLFGLPLLPHGDIGQALQDIRITINGDDEFSQHLLQAYVKRQWLDCSSVGPERLSVRDSRSHTNNFKSVI